MPNWLSDSRTFFRENLANFKHTGSMVPSSGALGRALTRYVRESANGANGGGVPQRRRILECGPGVGPVTRYICQSLGPDDTFDLCELNSAFCDVLRRRFAEEPPFVDVAARATIHHKPLEELPTDEPFDLIVSGLPLNNFEPHEVEQIVAIFGRLLKPTGTLSFFEYIGMRGFRAVVSNSVGRQRIRSVKQVLDGFLRHEIRRDDVWFNFPPAWVHHLRIQSA